MFKTGKSLKRIADWDKWCCFCRLSVDERAATYHSFQPHPPRAATVHRVILCLEILMHFFLNTVWFFEELWKGTRESWLLDCHYAPRNKRECIWIRFCQVVGEAWWSPEKRGKTNTLNPVYVTLLDNTRWVGGRRGNKWKGITHSSTR